MSDMTDNTASNCCLTNQDARCKTCGQGRTTSWTSFLIISGESVWLCLLASIRTCLLDRCSSPAAAASGVNIEKTSIGDPAFYEEHSPSSDRVSSTHCACLFLTDCLSAYPRNLTMSSVCGGSACRSNASVTQRSSCAWQELWEGAYQSCRYLRFQRIRLRHLKLNLLVHAILQLKGLFFKAGAQVVQYLSARLPQWSVTHATPHAAAASPPQADP
jgi:hypothetical protein